MTAFHRALVRVTREENKRARIILESHYLFTPKFSLLGLENVADADGAYTKRNWGIGPVVALQPGTDNVIGAVGGGLMIGFRRPSEAPKATDSFNIGVGVMYDLNAQVLGDDIFENRPLPAGGNRHPLQDGVPERLPADDVLFVLRLGPPRGAFLDQRDHVGNALGAVRG